MGGGGGGGEFKEEGRRKNTRKMTANEVPCRLIMRE